VIWLVPAALVAVFALPVWLGLRRVAAEAAQLRGAVAELAALAEPVHELRLEAHAAARRVPELRFRTRPALPPAS
jgi:hypothetical protein